MGTDARGDDDGPRPVEAVVPVLVPDIGEGLFPEKLISGWHVDDGGAIQAYAPLFTVSTDKIDVEVPSPATGIVEIHAPCQSIVRAGDVAAIIHCAG